MDFMPIFDTWDAIKTGTETASIAADLDAKRMANKATSGLMDKFSDDPMTTFIAMHPEAAMGIMNAMQIKAMKPIYDKIAGQSGGQAMVNPVSNDMVTQGRSQDLANGGSGEMSLQNPDIQRVMEARKVMAGLTGDPYKNQEINIAQQNADANSRRVGIDATKDIASGFGADSGSNLPVVGAPVSQPIANSPADGEKNAPNFVDDNSIDTANGGDLLQGDMEAAPQVVVQPEPKERQKPLTPQETVALKAGLPVNGQDVSGGFIVSDEKGNPVVKNALSITAKRQLQSHIDNLQTLINKREEEKRGTTKGLSGQNLTNAVRSGVFGEETANKLNAVSPSDNSGEIKEFNGIVDSAMGALAKAEGMATNQPRTMSFINTLQQSWPTPTMPADQATQLLANITNTLGVGSIQRVYPDSASTYMPEIKKYYKIYPPKVTGADDPIFETLDPGTRFVDAETGKLKVKH